jgi:pimeloyl-ACP methyl ester carboxylesterase
MEWGSSDNPSVIMLHGNHAHAHWFQFIGGLLAEKYHFVVMSFSGMGESEWRSQYDKDTFVEDVWGVVKETDLIKPVVVGHSFGGMVSLSTAEKYSDQMSGLVLVDFVVRRPENHIEWYKNMPPSKPPKVRATKEELVQRFRLMPPQECQNQYLLDFIADKSVRKTDQGWSWTFDPSTYDNLEVGNDQHETLNQLDCPVSFIYGENTMEFDTGNSIEEMKELLPEGSSVVALADAQHHLMLDKPLEFVKELDKLIQGFF